MSRVPVNPPFKIIQVDPNMGRIIYRTKNPKGEKIYYGLYQEAPTKFTLYRLCQELEAQCRSYAKVPLCQLLEIPKGHLQIERDVHNWLLNQLIDTGE